MTHPDAIQDPTTTPAPGWCENMVLQVHDSAAGVSVWAHWGRIPDAPHVWEGVLVVFLPDGALLTSRAFGGSAEPDTASSGALTLRCVEPAERWLVSFDGMALPTTEAALAAGPQPDGPIEHVTVDLAFTGVHPLYGGVASDQTWASAHFDHGGRIAGTVTHAGTTYAIDGAGFRDHSYGARDYSKLVGDTWCTAVFPSGRALLGIEVWQDAGAAYRQGFTFDGTTLTPAGTIEVPRLQDVHGAPHRFTMRLGEETIDVEQQASMAMTFGRPVGLVMGARLDDPALPVITEGPAKVVWDGETADGWIEKSLRPGDLRS